jgi:uncharacterized protein YjdB
MRIRNWIIAALVLLLSTSATAVAQKPVAEVQVAPPSVTLRPGATHKLSALAYDGDGNVIAAGVRYAWSSNNVNVARVDSTGTVTAVAPGAAVIRAEAAGTGTPPKRGESAVRVRRPAP